MACSHTVHPRAAAQTCLHQASCHHKSHTSLQRSTRMSISEWCTHAALYALSPRRPAHHWHMLPERTVAHACCCMQMHVRASAHACSLLVVRLSARLDTESLLP
eukprot:365085-Chlamydomonas_euryale.AAC.7